MCYNGIFHIKNVFAISGFDVAELSEDGPDDIEGLDSSVAHIAKLLSTEPSDGKFFHCITLISQHCIATSMSIFTLKFSLLGHYKSKTYFNVS